MEIGKAIANRGVERNKKPLQNIVYNVKVKKEEEFDIKGKPMASYKKYKFKEEGYLILEWQYEKDLNKIRSHWNWHGFITPDDLKERIGIKQWAKFCEGKRTFVIQRRIDGKNIKKKVKND